KFIANPFAAKNNHAAQQRLYRSGDIARYRRDGAIEFIGRIDHQVKLRGFRIELGEIEAALNAQPGIETSVVLIRDDDNAGAENKQLVAYLVALDAELNTDEVRSALVDTLPAYMVPTAFVLLDELPLTHNGKVNTAALPTPSQEQSATPQHSAPRNDIEKAIVEIWQQVLKLEQVGVHDNFFSLGGNSLLLAQVHDRIQQALARQFSIIELFKYPSIATLASHLSGEASPVNKTTSVQPAQPAGSKTEDVSDQLEPIAIIAMSGRFPGASNLENFWRNIREGIESITFYTNEELREAGMPEALLNDPDYVPASIKLDDVEMFDATFFGYSPRQAQAIDPQQRFFLECAWEVMERAAYAPGEYPGRVGVFAGVSTNGYLNSLIHSGGNSAGVQVTSFNDLDMRMGNDKDFLTTRVSYNLNLTGPGVTLQTACSTSLVATHLAIQALRTGDCDMAIAGGSCIRNYDTFGYRYQEGGILSPDGHCRAFDADAQGTVSGDGTTAVLLKRLSDAIADGDQIYAVIKGSAINNDGSEKIGYTAPAVKGQAEVIAAAQAQAGVDARSISYIEAHGTGTPLGDPIEIEALSQVFRQQTNDRNFCAIGSVKTNLGHLDSAAGVAGLIKTTLSLWHEELPPSLHYHAPNPQIDFDNNPFYVNAELTPWQSDTAPRRAGVSSFGIGGTNVHVVLEEAPVIDASTPAQDWQLLLLSARTATALETMTDNLHDFLRASPGVNLADVAYTLQLGRQTFTHRRAILCRDVADAIDVLASRNPARINDSVVEDTDRPVVFMFTGQGAQYPSMGQRLYLTRPYYREQVDLCCDRLQPHIGLDLRAILYPADEDLEQARIQLNRTEITQCALFVTEYALAKLWMSMGIAPAAMIGHSIGEYTAACLAGVMSLDDALKLVAKRGELMGALETGSMLAVSLSEAELTPRLPENIEIATINGVQMCAVSGPHEAIEAFADTLAQQAVQTQKLHTSHAFHSFMMEPVLESFTDYVSAITLSPPQIPYLSNVSGNWINDEAATDAGYYATHLRRTVRFAEGLSKLFARPDHVFLEVGPGHTLSSLARHHPDRQPEQQVVSSLRHVRDKLPDEAFLWQAIGQLWLAGARPDWAALHQSQRRHRLLLPTYPFERQRYWVEQSDNAAQFDERQHASQKIPDSSRWCYQPVWKSSVMHDLDADESGDYSGRWLLLIDREGPLQALATRIAERGGDVIVVRSSETRPSTTGQDAQFRQTGENRYELNPACRDDFLSLLSEAGMADSPPAHIVHAFGLEVSTSPVNDEQWRDKTAGMIDTGFYSLLYLGQAINAQWPAATMHIDVITRNVQAVNGNEKLQPENALVAGLCKVLPMDLPGIACRHIDLELTAAENHLPLSTEDGLLAELGKANANTSIAYRHQRRWLLDYENTPFDASKQANTIPPRL
ncbi:MAG TPA: acyltransferase domain-containing protein, partial [Thiotrichales bacterium]|nr:acyltransferase domain-containing protein [Thiotrichales bacterium]